MRGPLRFDIQRCDKAGKVSLDGLAGDVIRHQSLHLDEHSDAIQFVHAEHQITDRSRPGAYSKREQMLAVYGPHTRERHPAPVIAVAPAVRSVGLVILPDRRI